MTKEEKKFIPDGTHLTASQSEDSEEGWKPLSTNFRLIYRSVGAQQMTFTGK